MNKSILRLLIYGFVVATILIIKGPWRPGGQGPPLLPLPNADDTSMAVTLKGEELAPELLRRLASTFETKYPVHHVIVEPGGTAFGLEALANGKAGVAVLYRPPTPEERTIIYSTTQDSVAWYPIALGGILFLRGTGSTVDSLSVSQVRDLLRGEGVAGVERLYVPDPNLGLWGALWQGLGLAEPDPRATPPNVTFVKDADAVRQAVMADPTSLGLASSLLPYEEDPLIRAVPVRADTGRAVLPTYEAIGYAQYPFYHYLYVAFLPYRNLSAGKFITYLTSDSGQRAVEKAGFLPSRMPMWEIQLTQKPVGAG